MTYEVRGQGVPVGEKTQFMQDGGGIHRGLVAQNWWIVEER